MKNTVLELRRERELSQEDLARAAGVSRQTIISIEKGRYAPSLALAFTLANIFDTSIESMFKPETDHAVGTTSARPKSRARTAASRLLRHLCIT